MSQYPPALVYLLNWEDPQRLYRIVPDIGGYAIAGVNSHAWPDDYAKIAASSSQDRALLVNTFYLTRFWNPMKIGGIDFQDLANRILDMGVNSGGETAIKLLQQCLNTLNCKVIVDGQLGPETFDATNDQEPERLLALYRNARLMHYKRIVDNNPQDATVFGEWERRALA